MIKIDFIYILVRTSHLIMSARKAAEDIIEQIKNKQKIQ